MCGHQRATSAGGKSGRVVTSHSRVEVLRSFGQRNGDLRIFEGSHFHKHAETEKFLGNCQNLLGKMKRKTSRLLP
jgi:surfactin synthase thioesterase subunit